MARWADIAEWVGPAAENFGDGDYTEGEAADRMYEVRGVVIHIAEGTYAGTIAWQDNPVSDVSSHFTAAKDGRIAQSVDTSDRAWTQGAGNGHWLSVENEGYHTQAPTPQQIETLARILAKAHQVYGVPLVATDDPNGRGLGWHGMGGAAWGGHYDCPGPQFKAARAAIIARAQEIVGGHPVSEQDDAEAWRIDALTYGAETVRGGPVKGEEMWLVRKLNAIDDKLTELLATGGTPEGAAIVAKMEELAEQERERDAALREDLAAAAQAEADALKP